MSTSGLGSTSYKLSKALYVATYRGIRNRRRGQLKTACVVSMIRGRATCGSIPGMYVASLNRIVPEE